MKIFRYFDFTRKLQMHSPPDGLQDSHINLKDAEVTLTRKIELLMRTATDGIHIVDQCGKLVEASDAFLHMLGYTRDEMIGLHVLDWNQNWNPEAAAKQLADTEKHALVFETLYRRKNGSFLNVEIYIASASFDGQDYMCVASHDITERKNLEQELRIAATAFESREAVIIMDENKIILRANRTFIAESGYLLEEVIGKTPAFLRASNYDEKLYAEMWHQIDSQGYWRGERITRRKNGEEYPAWLSIAAVTASDGKVTNYVAAQTDISHRKAAEKQIMELAYYDSLTKLGNRRLLLDELQRALNVSSNTSHYGAILFIDLDNFKAINDTEGHDIGDKLLQQVALRLNSCARGNDTIVRLGGDEFVLVLTELGAHLEGATQMAKKIAEQILSALNAPYNLNGNLHYNSPSIGISLFGIEHETPNELLRRADLAMYHAKASGRNALRFFEPAMQTAIEARTEHEISMRRGIQFKEFVVYYQPQVSREGRLLGAEALVRWQHPRRGLLSPCDFIPMAEESGLIIPLGWQVLEVACQQVVDWEKQYDLNSFTISVNISARQIKQLDFVDQILSILHRINADPHKLELELTESLLLDNVEDTIAKMSALRLKGVRFSLDDFGTGYSSLSYLKRLPLDQLKIDRSFVRDLLVAPNDIAIVRMIVALGKTMGLKVVAEGVETEDQRNVLANCDCHVYQGYLFGRPMGSQQFMRDFLRTSQTP